MYESRAAGRGGRRENWGEEMDTDERKAYEILAPAGCMEGILPVIEAGADAVYVGLSGHSSRPASADFTPQMVREAARLCHDRHVRLHLAVNGAAGESGCGDLLDTLVSLDGAVDAFILSDWGILAEALRRVRRSEIHVSTLTGVYNAAAIRHLRRLGASRIVFSTNLYLQEMADLIAQCPDMDYEIVASGGICMNDNRLCELPHEGKNGEFQVFCQNRFQMETVYGAGEAGSAGRTAGDVPEAGDGGERRCSVPVALGEKQIEISFTAAQYLEIGVYSYKIEGRTIDWHYLVKRTERLRQGLERALEADFARASVSHYVRRFRHPEVR